MSPDPNNIPFEPGKKNERGKFTIVKPSEHNWILTDFKLTQVKQRGPLEEFRYIQLLLTTDKLTELEKLWFLFIRFFYSYLSKTFRVGDLADL